MHSSHLTIGTIIFLIYNAIASPVETRIHAVHSDTLGGPKTLLGRPYTLHRQDAPRDRVLPAGDEDRFDDPVAFWRRRPMTFILLKRDNYLSHQVQNPVHSSSTDVHTTAATSTQTSNIPTTTTIQSLPTTAKRPERKKRRKGKAQIKTKASKR
jgi:hypothetical protein